MVVRVDDRSPRQYPALAETLERAIEGRTDRTVTVSVEFVESERTSDGATGPSQ